MNIMKKICFHTFVILLCAVVAGYLGYVWNLVMQAKNTIAFHQISIQEEASSDSLYEVYQYHLLKKTFHQLDEAIHYGKTLNRSYIKQKEAEDWLWDNYKPFIVYKGEKYMNDFETFIEALQYVKKYKNGKMYFQTPRQKIWDQSQAIKEKVILDVPHILQYPELPRGCEVTSLAMLLQYKGIQVDKMTLAEEVKKDTTPFRKINGSIYFGNPNNGFVGSMYSLEEPGYGSYHGPIFDLLNRYIPDKSVDMTGFDFEDLYPFLDQGVPVWVIVNTTYGPLSPDEFVIWDTPSGKVEVTSKEHSVLITGYDSDYIYFNDPLLEEKNTKVDKNVFKAMWEQMGKQAVTYIP